MVRVNEAILDEKAFARGSNQQMVDLTYGGQFGFSPDISQFVNNAAYVRRNLICIMLEAPKFFQLMPEPEKWVQTLKALFELHPKTIDGYDKALTVEFDEHAVGGAGEMQSEVINVTRARSEPVFTYTEKYGLPIQTFLYNWITFGLMDPDSKFALISTITGEKPADMLPDWYGASILVFEPDPSHKKVVKSWVTTNMMPKGTGEMVGKRDLTTANETLELSIEFTGISQTGIGTDLFAQNILDQINTTSANPNLRPSFIQDIDSDVRAAEKGYEQQLEELGSTAVPGVAP